MYAATLGIRSLSAMNAFLFTTAKIVIVIQATVMVSSIIIQVATRVTVNWSPPWTEEVALLMFGWIVLLMIAIGIRERLHVGVDVLAATLPPAAAKMLDRAIFALLAAIACYLLWSGYGYLMEMRGSRSNAIRYPMELLYLSMPVSATLMLLFSIENAMTGEVAPETSSDRPS